MNKTFLSHGTTSPSLDTGGAPLPYFLRVLPSELDQVDIIVKSLLHFRWNYTQLIYSNDDYGQQMREMFNAKLRTSGICMVVEHSFETSNFNWSAIIDSLMSNHHTRAVVIFAPPENVREFLTAVKARGLRGRFTWIAPSTWANNDRILEGLEEVAEGAFTIGFENSAPSLDVFQDYISGLTPEVNEDNPWFKGIMCAPDISQSLSSK